MTMPGDGKGMIRIRVRIKNIRDPGIRCIRCGGPADKGDEVHWRRVYDDRPDSEIPYIHKRCRKPPPVPPSEESLDITWMVVHGVMSIQTSSIVFPSFSFISTH